MSGALNLSQAELLELQELQDSIDLVRRFNQFYMPIVICIGFAGNALSIMVFLSSKLRMIPSSHHLTALAFSDSGVLFCQLSFAVGFSRPSPLYCQLFQYVYYVFSFLSVWLVVSFTVERFVVVCFPLQRMKLCTVARARAVVLGLVAVGCTLNAYHWRLGTSKFYPNVNMSFCTVADGYAAVANVMNITDTVLTMGLPLLSIVVFNCIIAHRLLWYSPQAFAQDAVYEDSSSRRRVNSCAVRQRKTIKVKEQMITRMLLVISMVFLVMNVPDHLVRISIYVETTSLLAKLRLELAQSITSAWFNTGFAINFFLYNIVGVNFRRYLKRQLFYIAWLLTRRPVFEKLCKGSSLSSYQSAKQLSTSPGIRKQRQSPRLLLHRRSNTDPNFQICHKKPRLSHSRSDQEQQLLYGDVALNGHCSNLAYQMQPVPFADNCVDMIGSCKLLSNTEEVYV